MPYCEASLLSVYTTLNLCEKVLESWVNFQIIIMLSTGPFEGYEREGWIGLGGVDC